MTNATETLTDELNQRKADAAAARRAATDADVKARKAEEDVVELQAALDALAKAPPPATKPAPQPAPKK